MAKLLQQHPDLVSFSHKQLYKQLLLLQQKLELPSPRKVQQVALQHPRLLLLSQQQIDQGLATLAEIFSVTSDRAAGIAATQPLLLLMTKEELQDRLQSHAAALGVKVQKATAIIAARPLLALCDPATLASKKRLLCEQLKLKPKRAADVLVIAPGVLEYSLHGLEEKLQQLEQLLLVGLRPWGPEALLSAEATAEGRSSSSSSSNGAASTFGGNTSSSSSSSGQVAAHEEGIEGSARTGSYSSSSASSSGCKSSSSSSIGNQGPTCEAGVGGSANAAPSSSSSSSSADAAPSSSSDDKGLLDLRGMYNRWDSGSGCSSTSAAAAEQPHCSSSIGSVSTSRSCSSSNGTSGSQHAEEPSSSSSSGPISRDHKSRNSSSGSSSRRKFAADTPLIRKQLAHLVVQQPMLLYYSSQYLQSKIQQLQEVLGFDWPSLQWLLWRRPALLTRSVGAAERSYRSLSVWKFDSEYKKELLLEHPLLLRLAPREIHGR